MVRWSRKSVYDHVWRTPRSRGDGSTVGLFGLQDMWSTHNCGAEPPAWLWIRPRGALLGKPSSRLWQSVRQTGLRQAVRSQSGCERTHAFSWWVTFSPIDAFLVKFSATAKMNRILSWKSEDVWSVEKR